MDTSGEPDRSRGRLAALRGHFKYIATQGPALAVATGMSQFFGLLILLVFHECGVSGGYGTYNLVLATTSLIGICSLTGMNNAILVAAAQGKTHILRTATRRRIRFSIMIGWPVLSLTGLVVLIGLPERSVLGHACFILLPLFPIAYSFEGIYSYLNGLRQFWLMAKAQAAFAVVSFLGVCLCVIYLPEWVLVPPVLFLGLKAIVEAALYVVVVRRDRIALLDEDRKMLTYGMKVTLTGMASTVQARLNRVIVGVVYGVTELDGFAAGRAITLPARQLLATYRNLYTPKLAQTQPAEALRQTHRAFRWALLGIVPIIAVFYLLVPWFFTTFLARYETTGEISGSTVGRWYLIAMLVGVPFWFFISFLQAQRKARYQVIIVWTTVVVMAAGLLLFMRYFGVMGVLYAHVLAAGSQSLHSAILAQRSRREEDAPPPS